VPPDPEYTRAAYAARFQTDFVDANGTDTAALLVVPNSVPVYPAPDHTQNCADGH
jgi:hypothetical protein